MADTTVPVLLGDQTQIATQYRNLGGQYAPVIAAPLAWTVTHSPAANTQATATKAAGAAGVRHVCTGIVVSLCGTSAAPPAGQQPWVLRDGATGAGTVLVAGNLAMTAVAGAGGCVALLGLNIVGTAATAMTLEFTAAFGANSIESVTLIGYDVS